MRNCIKSYHVFLSSRLFQIMLYALYLPMMMLMVLVLLCASLEFGFGIGMGYQLSANLLFVGEAFWGYWILGGVAAKDTNKLEYLKTSVKCMPVLRTAMTVDVIRRVIWVTAIQWIPLFIAMEKPDESIWLTNAMVLLFAELGCLLERKSSSMAMFLGVVIGGSTLLAPILGLTMFIANQIWPIVLCYVLAVVVMILNIKMVMKKARDSFYDDRNEKVSEAV